MPPVNVTCEMKPEYCIAHYNSVWPFHRPQITLFSVLFKFYNYKGAELYFWIGGLPGQLVCLLPDWEHPSFHVHLHTFSGKLLFLLKKKKTRPLQNYFWACIAPEWRRPMPAATQTNWSISEVRTKVIRRSEAFHNQETPETAGNKVKVQESKQAHTHTNPPWLHTVNFCRNSFQALPWFTNDLR